MDSIELARQHARQLHDAAVQRGQDPWSPYQFAVGVSEHLGIHVNACAPGSSMLDGGRAFFDADIPAIFHESTGTAFDQAFLVAHEIGHSQRGDGEVDSEPVEAVDPARTSEAAPVGMDRVVDYSRRQRREVQMDLFARELLLPRPVAVDLHVGKGQTCSAIAQRLGAPFEVVAQQMLDALLLPAIPPVVAQADIEIPLNEKQRAAAEHRGPAFLLQAGPGTGKTRTLVARVESLLDDGVDPRRILLLTFSNKAAGEMTERIAKKRPTEAAALCIGTFHSFGLDILRRFNDRCELPANPHLMDRTEAVELLENEFPRLGLIHYRNVYDPSQMVADILNAVSRAKDEVVDAAGYQALADAMHAAAANQESMEAAAKAAEVAKVYACYERLKSTAQRVDFGDLVMLPVLLLERDEAVRSQLQNDYDHILVDEYQDVNHSSVRLLAALAPTGTNLWVVGDAKQSIYRFRGASSFSMSRFGRDDFPDAVRDSLDINYRSTLEVVTAFSTFAQSMAAAEPGEQALKADRGPGGSVPQLITVGGTDLVTPSIADGIKKMLDEGYRYCDQAILCRGNDRLSSIAQELERAGIPVLFLGSLFERPEVKDLLAVLTLLIDRRAMGLIRTAFWPEFSMGLEDTVRVFEHLRNTNAEAGAWGLRPPIDMTDGGQAALLALHTALLGFDVTSQPWTVLATLLLDRTRQAARIATGASVAERAQGIAIWQFMNFVKVQPKGKGLPIQRLVDRIRRLLRLGDDKDLRQLPAAAQGIDAVRLMTIHGSKGLEFPVVHIAGANKDSIPGSFRAPKCPPPVGMVSGAQGSEEDIARTAHIEEQECLFYVAMSRARDRLAFYAATATATIKGRSRPLSPFLDQIGYVDQQAVTPTTVLPPAPDEAIIPVVFSGTPKFSADQVALYDSCARRFLYTHLLEVGGRRRMSAFMLMHEAVRGVYRTLVAQGSVPTGDLDDLLSEAFIAHGLHEHGYVDDYKSIAASMLRYFLDSRAGAAVEAHTALSISFGDHVVEVRPDEVLVRDGVRTIRRVRTGHAPSKDDADVGAAAFLLAARAAFPGASVELVYLADAVSRPLTITPTVLANRQETLSYIFRSIQTGQFKAKVSERTCPNCPAFFVCGAVPPGALSKNF